MDSPSKVRESREEALAPSQPVSGETSSLCFILDKAQNKRRAEALTAVYQFILSDAWGAK